MGALDATVSKEEKDKRIKEVEMELVQISPEDKMDAIYQFVMGLLSKAKGDFNSARKYLEKAVAMDSTMIFARRELTMMSSVSNQKKDVFQADLRDLVGGFFKKR
jgi:hypothetical protein